MSRNKILVVGGFVLFLGLFLASSSKALSEDEVDIFSHNSILFYDPSCLETGTDVSICNTNLPEATIKALEDAGVKDKAEQNIERYKYAEEKTGIPWQAIAALHWREGGMSSSTSISNGQPLASSGCYENWDHLLICSDPNEDAKSAAEHLISMAKWVYDVDLNMTSTIDEWGQAFLAYNRGVIYKRAGVDWKESPYPMNGFDEAHALYMQRPGIENTSPMYLTGRDLNIGALAVFAYLCGSGGGVSSSSSNSVSSALSKEITLVGDSIAVGAGDKLRAKFPGSFMTMVVSRHPTAKGMCDGDEGGLTILEKIVAGTGTVVTQSTSGSCGSVTIDGNSLKDNIVWELGANSVGANKSTMEAAVSAAGERNLFLVTPYDGNNLDNTNAISDIYRHLAEEYDNVYIVDWNKEMLSGGASKYLSSDGVHPNSSGQDLLVDLIAKALEDSQACTTISYKDSKYQERLGNLHTFNQGSGTWAYRQEGCSGSGTYIYNNGCGLMSIYAAYYMFSGNGLDDEQSFLGINNAAMTDNYYVCSYYGDDRNGSFFDNFGKNLEDFTGMKAEHFWNGSYSDSQWDDFVAELKKGHKLLIGTTGSSCGGSSLFAGCMHALLLDHYDESKDAVYLFDPNMSSYKVSTSGAEAFSSDVRDGAYISRTVMNDYLRPDSAYALIYGDDSCYNICEPKGGNETTPIYPLDEDSADIACAQGTKDLGVYENAHYFGKEIKVRLCALPNLPSSGSESVSSSKYYIDGAEGKAVVNSRVSGAFYALVERAKSEGIDLTASSSFRAYAHQADLWVENGCSASGCSGTTTAPAGSSNHEGGYAIDFNGTCSFGIGPAACDASGNVVSLWLRDNIGDFGFVRTVSTEAWHVDAPVEPLNGED